MKIQKEGKEYKKTWEEESGLIHFLSKVPGEVTRFNARFQFGIRSMVPQPARIDGDDDLPMKTAFVLIRDNPLMTELTYCLYALLVGRELQGHIGTFRNGSITTVRHLDPIKDFTKGKDTLYDWLRQLVRASCEKP